MVRTSAAPSPMFCWSTFCPFYLLYLTLWKHSNDASNITDNTVKKQSQTPLHVSIYSTLYRAMPGNYGQRTYT